MALEMTIHKCNFRKREHKQAFISLLNAYMEDPMGVSRSLDPSMEREVIQKIQRYPHCQIFLANLEGAYVGMAVCFSGFSTFRAKEVLNIHDFIVKKEWRGRGVGQSLMAAVEEYALKRDCCKITLEVREDNTNARELYKKVGFKEEDIPMNFWAKYLPGE